MSHFRKMCGLFTFINPKEVIISRSIGTALDFVDFWVQALRSIVDGTTQDVTPTIDLSNLTVYLHSDGKYTKHNQMLASLAILFIRISSVCMHLFDVIDFSPCESLENPAAAIQAKIQVWIPNNSRCNPSDHTTTKLITSWNIAVTAISS